MKARDLITTARSLTELDPRQPTQANLRRAVSTAYYAVFHSLAHAAADLLIGRESSAAWHQVYRALEHGNAKSACQNKQSMQRFPHEIKEFADAFVALQGARHRADYSSEANYDRQETLAAIDKAEDMIDKFEAADREQRLGFVAHLLFRRRSRQEIRHG